MLATKQSVDFHRPSILKISSFMLLNNMRVSKWWQNFHSWVNSLINVPQNQLIIWIYSSSVCRIQDGPNLIPSSPSHNTFTSVLLHVSPLPPHSLHLPLTAMKFSMFAISHSHFLSDFNVHHDTTRASPTVEIFALRNRRKQALSLHVIAPSSQPPTHRHHAVA